MEHGFGNSNVEDIVSFPLAPEYKIHLAGLYDAWSVLQAFGVISGDRVHDLEAEFQGQKTGLVGKENTGIVVCPSMRLARETIDANPVGFELPEAAGYEN